MIGSLSRWRHSELSLGGTRKSSARARFDHMAKIQSSLVHLGSNSRSNVLIVDDEERVVKLLAEVLRRCDYSCVGCKSGEEALALLNTEKFDVVLCDLRMPTMSGLEVLRIARAIDRRVGFVIVTGEADVHVSVRAMKEGADDYLLKPLNVDEVPQSVSQVLHRKGLEAELENYHLHLEEMVEAKTAELQRAMRSIERTYYETLQALSGALDLKDRETAGHSQRVMSFAVAMANALGSGEDQIRTIARGALLHDVGKIGVPDAILAKPGPLTASERAVMQTHVTTGYKLLNRIPFLAGAAEIVLTHHERYDGKGYPQGLRQESIPHGSRIFAVADTLDAMTSNRPYRQARTFAIARSVIIQQSGKQFDPDVVSAFVSICEREWDDLRNGKQPTTLLPNAYQQSQPSVRKGNRLQFAEASA
jgi:putative nucleotidyltransferase with HDIG domain